VESVAEKSKLTEEEQKILDKLSLQRVSIHQRSSREAIELVTFRGVQLVKVSRDEGYNWFPVLRENFDSISSILFHRAEGVIQDAGARHTIVPVSASISDQEHALHRAESVLFGWGLSAPKNMGYDKVDFSVIWSDGFVYRGRFDLVFGGKDSSGSDFRESLTRRIAWMTDFRQVTGFGFPPPNDELRARFWNGKFF